jgi:hypothetical protein
MRTSIRTIVSIGVLLSAVGLVVSLGHAQDGGDEGDRPASEAQANGSASTAGSADDQAGDQGTQPDAAGDSSEAVMQQLLKQREQPSVEPTDPQAEQGGDGQTPQVDMPAAGVEADPSVLGVAPSSGEGEPTLRREGEFIVNRRGHLARAKDSNRLLFVFSADKQSSPEAPMILQACRTLETMEKIVQKRGESVPFIISGQVHTYRNQNYLMPTMMKIAEQGGNLK